jgi:hypothetical protein
MQRSFIQHMTLGQKRVTPSEVHARNLMYSQQTKWLCAFTFSVLFWSVNIPVAAADVRAEFIWERRYRGHATVRSINSRTRARVSI